LYTLLFTISLTIFNQWFIYDQPSAKAFAMNSSLISVEDESFSSFCNPGGLAFIKYKRAINITVGNKKLFGASYAQQFQMANLGIEFFYEHFSREIFPLENKPRTFFSVLISKKLTKTFGLGASLKLPSDYLVSEHNLFLDIGFLIKTPIDGLNMGICLKELYLKDLREHPFQNRFAYGLSYRLPTFFYSSLLFSFEYNKRFLNIDDFFDHRFGNAYFSYGLNFTFHNYFEGCFSSSFYRSFHQINGGVGINWERFSVFITRDKTLLPFFGEFRWFTQGDVYLLTFNSTF
jgi:hypothetical protein